MVLGEDVLEEGSAMQLSPEGDSSGDPEALFILESIVQRLKPRDAHHVRDMITQRGWISGALFMSSALFWWIMIKKGSEGMDDVSIPASLIGAFDFETLSLIVPFLVLVATLVMVIGREKGNATLSQAGGLLVVLALFYIVEPVLLNFSEIELGQAMFASGRLLMLAIMVGFASRFMFDAMLLQWVRASMLSMGSEAFPSAEEQTFESQADEAPPYA
ncbi:MAG: hypothetical protein QF911_05685 [Candidatus Thalassarchaeaceae archaeon]|jgi:hypothetical protein|nr:hypothetical protein [Candidatus Thalassarchaeaceae archaeon]